MLFPSTVVAEAEHIGGTLHFAASMSQSTRDVARNHKVPDHHLDLLCELNEIEDPSRDLRLYRKNIILLPPVDILKSPHSYCLMRKGETLREVLVRQGLPSSWDAVSVDVMSVPSRSPPGMLMAGNVNDWWGLFMQCNPGANWAAGQRVLDMQQEQGVLYVLLPRLEAGVTLQGPECDCGKEQSDSAGGPRAEVVAGASVGAVDGCADATAGGGAAASMAVQLSSGLSMVRMWGMYGGALKQL